MSACPNENLKMIFFFFDVPCSFRTWVIMALNIFLYLVPLSNFCLFQKTSNATFAPGHLSGLLHLLSFLLSAFSSFWVQEISAALFWVQSILFSTTSYPCYWYPYVEPCLKLLVLKCQVRDNIIADFSLPFIKNL